VLVELVEQRVEGVTWSVRGRADDGRVRFDIVAYGSPTFEEALAAGRLPLASRLSR
jgi:hypothetical protein